MFLFAEANAQISTNEKPVSFGLDLEDAKGDTETIQTITMPALDMAKIEAEDLEDEKYDMPPRFGYRHKVNYDLTNSGTWQQLSNGDKLWRLNIVCPGALSVNFCYDKFWIPEGGKFFVYSKDRKRSIGAFTSRNNKGDRENIRGFATGLVYGDDVILEYYQPKEATADAVISIEYVVHGYRYINFNMRLSSCRYMVNINCPEGDKWQNEKNAVALVIANGDRWCSGSLMVTSDLSQKPYFLTADHCLEGATKYDPKYDADTLPNLDHYSFWWNYEIPGCDNSNVEPPNITTNAATVVANNSYSDFALLRLSEDPIDLSNYTPYYLGWDNTGNAGGPGVCIHHPRGDVKKISTVVEQPTSTSYEDQSPNNNSHWKVYWKKTPKGYGVTQGGSSGASLLNASHKVIGQLHGGYSSCYNLNEPDWYGKFNVSWTGNGNDSIQRRLNHWLDSLNIGTQIMEGLLIIPSASTIATDQELYSNIRITSSGLLTVQSEVELMGNSRVIVESGGQLVVDGGTLSNVDIDLKAGASLRIINGGIIQTRNDFVAPEGAIVDITHGEITRYYP